MRDCLDHIGRMSMSVKDCLDYINLGRETHQLRGSTISNAGYLGSELRTRCIY